ncbi:MAG TPA: right-handed parallel beta-helix repeat-containing protein, partial [Bacteroidia bacterium]|nr:right-handed parallel beta-helix repeat-containing protein [Bacteroidia bacterium]
MKKFTHSLAKLKLIATAIALLITAQLQAQVTNVNTASTYGTLGAAISDGSTLAGHTLILTANLTEGLVTVNKSLTIDGQGFTLTSTSLTYGINPVTTNVSIQNLTVTGSGTFGILAPCGSHNLNLTNVTVTACGGSGIAISGSDNCVFTNVTCTSNNGNGISITNCDNTSIVGYTSSGNSFGGGFGAGIGLFTSSGFCLPAGINGFSLTGTVTIAENPRVYSQKAATAHVITGITGASIQWAVGTSANDRSYWPSKPIAYSVVDALFEPPYSFPNTTVYVEEVATDNLYVDDNPNGDATPPMLINTAVAMAQAGKTIFLEAGTFAERVIVDKSLTIDGDGMTTSILDGTGLPGTGSGISINNNITNCTVQELTVRNYALGSSAHAGIAAQLSNNNLTVYKCDVYNNSGGRGGVYVNGPVNNVLIDSVKAHDHPAGSRGIVVWNGLKQNVTIQNCEVYNNNCCGIELQDGTASGINVLNNNVYNNADNGIGLNGVKGGTGANVVTGNTVSNNGRFGIEVKNANADGTNAGVNSFVISGNTVSLTAQGNAQSYSW